MSDVSTMRVGKLEVECVIIDKDGNIKSQEKTTRDVSIRLDLGGQVTEITEM